ncbi:MAG: alpha-ribazole phosphatase [Methylomicrobium sp.]
MDVYLIRHTSTAVEKGLCFGQSDIPLANTFEQDAAFVLDKLPERIEHCRIYSSPLSRCRRLAEKLAHTYIADERLLELNFGDWEGVPFDAIESDALHDWTERFADIGPPNGESFSDLCRRAAEFWTHLLTERCEQVFVVTHAGVIRALLSNVLNLPAATAFQFRVDHGSLHKLQYSDQYTYIHFLNR